jgi:hypothetical protein
MFRLRVREKRKIPSLFKTKSRKFQQFVGEKPLPAELK